MLIEAMARFGAEPRDTVMVGDHARDIEAARAADCPAMLVRTGRDAETARRLAAGVPVFDDLSKAVDAILAGATR
jgi:D-glycero-D-manno-heptose 1,7-bisphosphate phosphatase